MPVQWLFEWWNAVYTLPLAAVLVLLILTSLISLAGGALGQLSEADGGVEADHDADLHLDADTDVDGDLEVDGDVDLDGDGDGDVVDRAIAASHGHPSPEAGPGFLISALVTLGVGRAPLVMVLQVLVLFWGFLGLTLHQTLRVDSPAALLWSAPVTLVLSVLATRTFAGAFGRVFKGFETSAVRRHQIVGRTGRVVYTVSHDAGTVTVRDEHGTLHRVRARTEHQRLESGREIIILGYDPKTQVYQVDDVAAFVDRA